MNRNKIVITASAFLLLILVHGQTAADELASKIEADYQSYLKPLFIHFHENPELSTLETKTAARMAKELREAGFKVTEEVGGHRCDWHT